jgi:hypothetical protein
MREPLDKAWREAATAVLRREWSKRAKKPGVREIARRTKLSLGVVSDALSQESSKSGRAKRLATIKSLRAIARALGIKSRAKRPPGRAASSGPPTLDDLVDGELRTHVLVPFKRSEFPGIAVPATGGGLILRFASLKIPLFGGELRRHAAHPGEAEVRLPVFVRWRSGLDLLLQHPQKAARTTGGGDRTQEASFYTPFVVLDHRSANRLKHDPNIVALDEWSLARRPYFCFARYEPEPNTNNATLFRTLLVRRGNPQDALNELVAEHIAGRVVLAERGTDLELNAKHFLSRRGLSAEMSVHDSHTTSAAFHLLEKGKLAPNVVLAVGSAQYHAALGQDKHVRFLVTDSDLAPHPPTPDDDWPEEIPRYDPLVPGMGRPFWDESRYILACRLDSFDKPDEQLPWCGRIIQKLSNIIKPTWEQMGLAQWLEGEVQAYGGVGMKFDPLQLEAYVGRGMFLHRLPEWRSARFVPVGQALPGTDEPAIPPVD